MIILHNKKGLAPLIIIGIIVLVFALSIGGYFVYKSFSSHGDVLSGISTSEKGVTEIKGNFLDLLNSGKSMECSYQAQTSEGDTVSQIVYFSGDKFRMDSEVKLEYGQTTTTSIIGDKDWLYFWQMPMGTGWKISVEEYENQQTSSGQGIDFQEEYPFSCIEKQLDDDLFRFPIDIAFPDQTESFKGTVAIACSLCNKMSGVDKENCLKELRC